MTINDYNNKQVCNPGQVAEIFRAILSIESEIDQDKEHFWVIGVTNQNRIKFIELVTLGILDECQVHPREVFRLAIMQGVKAIIVAHNHPSSNLTPSKQDCQITRRLTDAGSLLLIPVLDHVIVSEKGFFSFKKEHIL